MARAYERSITRKPNRNDLLDIFQALGRVYQRAQRTDKAPDVWNRLEKLFPEDARVQEQIATTLIELGADLGGIVTESTLESGIEYALRHRKAGVNGGGGGRGS